MSDVTKITVIALDHLTMRWQDKDIDPRVALALGVVMNERAERDLPELGKITADMLIHGAGFYRVSATETKHIPFQDFRHSS